MILSRKDSLSRIYKRLSDTIYSNVSPIQPLPILELSQLCLSVKPYVYVDSFSLSDAIKLEISFLEGLWRLKLVQLHRCNRELCRVNPISVCFALRTFFCLYFLSFLSRLQASPSRFFDRMILFILLLLILLNY